MASGRKYAGLLPDLDEDRDLFETPELTDDTSTRPAESVDDEDDESVDAGATSGISRQRLDADTARSQFYGSRVDARRTDFSDRLDRKRKSYQLSTQRTGLGAEDLSDDNDDATPKEGLKRKIASLLREAEELKAEAQRQRELAVKEDEQPDGETLKQLSSAISILEDLGPSGGSLGAEARLAKQLGEAARPTNGDATPSESARRAPTYTLSYQPSFDDKHALSLAASFDARLKEMETALGLASLPLPTQADADTKPLLPTLDALEKQIELLATTTPASLETMSKRIRQLTDEADRLHEKRKAAKQSYAEMRAAAADAGGPPKSSGSGAPGGGGGGGGGGPTLPPSALMEDSEMEAKVSALYNTLPTIESLAPTLPAVLERLKSLRLLHADAADAASRVEHVESQGQEMREEIALWRQGLEKLEATVARSEESTKKNMQTVEQWIQDLETRAKGLKVPK